MPQEETTTQLAEVIQLVRKVDAATNLPEQLREKLDTILKRLRRMARQGLNSNDYESVAKYLDWVLAFPWGQYTEENLDLIKAREIMDKHHYGSVRVKEVVMEYLAILNRKLSSDNVEITSPVLAFVGVQGAGKTSLSKAIAKALNRPFIRISLGAIGDSSQLRGRSYTHEGADPGRIIKAISEAGCLNPVILLDEFDKVSGREDLRTDFMAIMLEILDPGQNKTFKDLYLDYPVDLSRVLFIATANSFTTISRELLDRLDIIRFEDYNMEEKAIIAKHFLFPGVLEYAGLQPNELQITDEAWAILTQSFGVDAGVRRYERNLQKLARKVAKKIVMGEVNQVIVDQNNAPQFAEDTLPSIKEIKDINYTADA